MSAERWHLLRALYDEVQDAPAADRARVLADIASRHPDVQNDLIDLCRADVESVSILDRPLADLFTTSLNAGELLADRFVLVRLIGRGGMGEVWEATDTVRGRTVALKTVRPSLVHDDQVWTRLKREIHLATRVAHANVCRVHELFEDRRVDPPRLFFTMELLEGETLAARLERGPLPAADALRVFADLCAGLGAAHAVGVIHRDLKPSNVILTVSQSRLAVITDFGLAKPEQPGDGGEATIAGMLLGTPAYMAPEQVRGDAATAATDIYALGLVVFEMLKGEPPFRGSSTLDSWMRRAREGVEPLAGKVAGVTVAVDDVIARCLEYEPARRFASPAAALAAVRKRRIPRLAVAAVVLVLVAVAAATVWSLRPMTLPAEAQQWYEEAQQAVAEGAAVRARNAVKRVLALAPQYPSAQTLLAEIHLELGMPAEATEDVSRASQQVAAGVRVSSADRLYLEGIHALALGECSQAVTALRTRADIAGAGRTYRMVTAARAFERCNRPDDALRTLSEARALDPRNAAIPLRTARPAGRRREYDRAMSALDEAEGLFRDRNNAEGRTEVMIRRGELLAEQNKLDQADEALAAAASLVSGLEDAVAQQVNIQLQQAVVLRKRGRRAEAERLTDAALDRASRAGLAPLTIDALFLAGNVHVVRRESSAAEVLFERARTMAETYRNAEATARGWLSLATAWEPMGQPEKAEAAVLSSLPHFRRTGDTRNVAIGEGLLGRLRLQRAEYAEAIEQFRSQLNAASTDPEQQSRARSNLAAALVGGGHYREAVQQYQQLQVEYRTAKLPVREAYAAMNLADAWSRLGRHEESTAVLQSASALVARPEVRASALFVQSANAWRLGDAKTALSFANEARAASQGVADWISRADAQACVAAAALRLRQVAAEACKRALDETPDPQRRAGWLESRLAVAEAWFRLGDRQRASDLAHSAVGPMTQLREHEDKWRLAALLAASAMADQAAPFRDLMTREWDAFRLRLGDIDFAVWTRRSDVRFLLASARERGDKQ